MLKRTLLRETEERERERNIFTANVISVTVRTLYGQLGTDKNPAQTVVSDADVIVRVIQLSRRNPSPRTTNMICIV